MARAKPRRTAAPEPPQLTLDAYRHVADQFPGDGVYAAYRVLVAHAEAVRAYERATGRRVAPDDGALHRMVTKLLEERAAPA
ncbi:hypothetical protein [Streptomyces noursei]|uniref:hypothetical protein n=1 Tax=Streptomyces noursei TaxID=1971 RepID=UPI0038229835